MSKAKIESTYDLAMGSAQSASEGSVRRRDDSPWASLLLFFHMFVQLPFGSLTSSPRKVEGRKAFNEPSVS
jgi:hypothetical protein